MFSNIQYVIMSTFPSTEYQFKCPDSSVAMLAKIRTASTGNYQVQPTSNMIDMFLSVAVVFELFISIYEEIYNWSSI